MRALFTALLPLPVLLVLTLLATLLSTGIVSWIDEPWPQAKLIGKLTLLLLLASIFPLRRLLRLSWQDLGFAAPGEFVRQLLQGMTLAVVSLLPVLLMLYRLDVHVWDQARHWNVGKLIGQLTVNLLMALLIGLGEETLFRGLLFAGLRRRLPLLGAMAVSALYFASLHFLKPQLPLPVEQHSLASGMALLLDAYRNWLNPQILPDLLCLFIIGLFLVALRLHATTSLGWCIGCHAGWVWQIKLFKDFCNLNPLNPYPELIGHYDGVIGPLISVWLLVGLLVWWQVMGGHRHKQRQFITTE